jgi:peptidoglycan/LPS O-acetylase OafA/YrhL
LLKYRPDIDGLRAIAVVLVILCHAEIAPFAGGYIGVDIFFVISGYLITRLIFEDLDADRFSFREFYLRRARRIIPALGVMVLATAGAGSVLVLPQHLESFSDSILAVCFFVSNIFFQNQAADYFEQTTLPTQPLLHTWSLGVEEQYYLVFPVLAFALWRWAKRSQYETPYKTVGKWFLRIGYLSFFLSLLLMNSYPVAAFYGLPSRFWELLVGSFLACEHFQKKEFSARKSAILSSVGGFLILGSAVTYSARTPFPGFAALAPCLGAALVLWTGQNHLAPLHRFLSSRPLRTVGALSYSLYLWHWPIGVFCKSPVTLYYLGWNPGVPIGWMITLGAAWLSWKYVECPIRQISIQRLLRLPFLAGSSALVVAILGLATLLKNQAVEFSPKELQSLFDKKPGYLTWEGNIDPADSRKHGGDGGRKLGIQNQQPSFILLGDSFATMWAPAVDKKAAHAGAAGILVAKSGCPPLRKIRTLGPACRRLADLQIEFVKSSPVKTIFLAINWRHTNLMDPDDQGHTLEAALEATLLELGSAKKNVYVVLTPPGSRLGPYQDAIRSLHDHKRAVHERAPASDSLVRRDLEILAELKKKYPFHFVDPGDKLCDDKGCLVAVGGKPLYADNFHLSDFGADFASVIFSQLLKNHDSGRAELRD